MIPIDPAMKILKEALVTSKYVIISKKYTYTVLFEDFAFYKRVRAKGYVNDLRLESEFKSEVTHRAWAEFRRAGSGHRVYPTVSSYGRAAPGNQTIILSGTLFYSPQ